MKEVQKVYIGSSSEKGIACYGFYEGYLSCGKWTNDEKKCTYLAKTNTHVYSVVEIEKDDQNEGGYVLTYEIGEEGLKKKEKKPSCGKGPCHIEIDQLHQNLGISHYSDGTFCVRSLKKDGLIGNLVFQDEGEKESRIHCAKWKDNLLFKIDLGKDKLIIYEMKENRIIKKEEYQFEKQENPRHLIVNGDEIYVITEKSCMLYEFVLKEEKLSLKNKQSLFGDKIKKEEKDAGSAIKMSQDKNNIYTLIRGKDLICVFRKEENMWKLVQTISSRGKMPWDIAIDNKDEYALVANAESNQITIFARNKNTGTLKYLRQEKDEFPTCILI